MSDLGDLARLVDQGVVGASPKDREALAKGLATERATGMDGLVIWLRAALDDDERVAREASEPYERESLPTVDYTGHWHVSTPDESTELAVLDGPWVIAGGHFGPGPKHAEHIARWDPARVLAEVAAKRRIIEIHHRIDCQHDRNYGPGGDCAECGGEYPCETVGLLALPLADREGYREEWRP